MPDVAFPPLGFPIDMGRRLYDEVSRIVSPHAGFPDFEKDDGISPSIFKQAGPVPLLH